MDTRSSKLTDLKLVNKHYPGSAIANYSYPNSVKHSEQAPPPAPASASEPTAAAAAPVGRSSVGSEASVPGMVADDRDSIISVDLSPLDGPERDSYHSSGAVLWDSFWEDPFWDATVEETTSEAAQAEGALTQRLMGNNNGSYPALIPSPDDDRNSALKHGYFAKIDACSTQAAPDLGLINGTGSTERRQRSWETSPKRGRRSRSATPKAKPASTYSLFPASICPLATIDASATEHSIPSATTTRNTMFCETTALDDSLIPAPLSLRKTPGRTAHLKVSDATTLAARSTWTQSTPVTAVVTAVVTGPLTPHPAVTDLSTRRDSAQSLGQRASVPLSRARPDTVMSNASVASSSQRRSGLNPQPHEVAPRPLPPIPPPVPPARRHRVRYSQPEVAISPRCSQIDLQRCMTEGQRIQASVSGRQVLLPGVPDPPMPVSVFEDDSEDDDGDGREERSFARRLARTLTTSKRTRSTTTTKVPESQLPTVLYGDTLEMRREEGSEPKGSDVRVLRKQRSEMFGRIFWGWH
ncbi:hypothetical protein BD289DRAFT_473757 [Coniella lustricola]|uniref:Uncharacterized protein n=1 Tax=Coniella lustricola TaxID=2025994 RepID=A0A2T3AA91_9PEZI|nr:hypothetical protein BD289DRAFT_473757 [Coniella lustricola]